MRQIRQPGPPAIERHKAVISRGGNFTALLQGGLLIDAVAAAFAARGFQGGVLRFGAGRLQPLHYVMPALSQSPEHAAFYSQPFAPKGVTELSSGAMTFGSRDGKPFFHCHAWWQEADGKFSGGHILPDATSLAGPLTIQATGLQDATFDAVQDVETGFKLFEPQSLGGASEASSGRFHALRLRPNQDLEAALRAYCRAHGIARAQVHGGVGSLIGARYADGRQSPLFATEMAIRSAAIAVEGDSRIEIDLIDYEGHISGGLISNGDNPVLMTMELVLEAEQMQGLEMQGLEMQENARG
ncbi:MAG: DUF296 domain-containing protein [Hyphomicrobiales bacterium]|nr:DUF296 domain-containing protein [Hyphomicrobiales bacterium]MDE2115257.1 DUF296 domain-containing protein [Hyphomicrobiales bacterium]